MTLKAAFSGQMVGKISRQLKKITSGKLIIPRIFALDPVAPGFENHHIEGFESISKTDGKYVQIIHTSAGELGMQRSAGNADFFPNGGLTQPGCDVNATASMLGSYKYICDQARSWQLYQASVRDPQAFPAVKCSSWDEFLIENGTCFKDNVVYMGFGANLRFDREVSYEI